MSVPSTWSVCDLEDVVVIHDDLRQPVNAEERSQRVGDYPYYGATGQVGWIDDYLMDGEYILLGEDGAPFLDPTKPKAYRVEGKSWVNNHAHVLRGVDGLLTNRFLLHALNCTDYRDFANGTTRLKLTQGAMRRIPLPVPPLPEQHRIVEKIEELFSDLDAGVASLQRAKANLKRYRASVLKSAVEGKLTEEWRREHPQAEDGQMLLDRIIRERREKWEKDQLQKFKEKGKEPPKNWQSKYEEPSAPDTSELPELPEGWARATIHQLNSAVRPISYGVLQPGDDLDEGVPLVRVCDVADGRVAIEQLKRIAPAISSQFQRTILQGGEVLLTVVGTIGRAAIVPKELAGANTARAVAVIAVVPPAIPEFLELSLRENSMRARLTQASHEVARKTLNLEDVRIAVVSLPPLAEQEQIVALVEERLSQIDSAEKTIDAELIRAKRLRQSILKQAFEGKLVPQDPKDEPASVLLERIKASREAEQPKKKATKVKARAK
jgi:type I restriction enzyme S subunit